jgi:hypothetical protein
LIEVDKNGEGNAKRSKTIAPNKQLNKKDLEVKAQIDSVVLKNKEYLIYHHHDEVKVGRMVLWKLSANNKFFLFEDKLKNEFRVYSLE